MVRAYNSGIDARSPKNSGWVMEVGEVHPQVIQVPRTWKVCPICQAERPTKANKAAAALRFAMDNDS